MPILTKQKHSTLRKALNERWSYLSRCFESRELKSAGEGARGSWVHPGDMCATVAGDIDLRLAVDDFKAILAEIRKLK